MTSSSSNSGLYWVLGLTAVGIAGYFVYQKWYNDNIKDNPAIKTYNWFTDIFS